MLFLVTSRNVGILFYCRIYEIHTVGSVVMVVYM